MRRFPAFLILGLLVFIACAKHKDFPLPLDVSEPPVPENFKVKMPKEGEYFLDWSVEDSLDVSYYKIYVFDAYQGPQEVDTTSVSFYHYDFYIPVIDVIWGVSSVSIENIESHIVFASASPE